MTTTLIILFAAAKVAAWLLPSVYVAVRMAKAMVTR